MALSAPPLALIIGASSGLGLAITGKLANQGFHCIALYRSRRQESEAARQQYQEWESTYGIAIDPFNLDATDKEQREKILNQLQEEKRRIKVMVHSLARGHLKPLWQAHASELLSEQDLLITLQAMATSYASWAQAILQRGLADSRCRFIALSSEGARKALPYYGAVAAAKAALEALNRQLATEIAAEGHTANILQPGVTDTPALRRIPSAKALLQQAQARNPTSRLTLPQEVANVVYLLCQPEADRINGAIIPVDGGENIAP